MLVVHEIFKAIQGESTFSGLPFSFIRLSGCNLHCSWCDTEPARSHAGKDMRIVDIVETVLKHGLRHVCVTGGEPLLQPATPRLLTTLLDAGSIVTLETNGSLPVGNVPAGVHRIIDIKCPSSGEHHRNHWDNLAVLRPEDEIKCVVANRTDYEFALEIRRKYLADFSGPVLFSPVWDLLDPGTLAQWVLADGAPVRVHLQMHKILGTK